MIAFAYYLLKMFVCSGLLFCYYHLALRNKLFHQWNRFYLLAAIIISLVVPLLQFDVWSAADDSSDIKLLKLVYSADEYVATVTANRTELSLDQWITIIYSLASIFVFAIFVLALGRIYAIIKSHSVVSIDDIKFVNTEEKSAPFSFLNYVVWNKQIDLNTTSGEHIFQHELVHVREKHSFDTLFLQLVLIVFWCNPFFWLIRRELRMIHEFIADKRSVGQSDAHAFATMILQTVYPQHYTHLTNQFFHQSIKRRLAMLTKNNNPKLSYLSRVLALPLMALLIMAFTIKQKNKATENVLENFQSVPITDTTQITLDKNTEIVEFLTERIKLINKLNVVSNNNAQQNIKEINEKNKTDSSTPRPLIIIDGKEIDKKNISDLNQLITPEKINSINVLKDEAAIAKYGQKGKDGVIEIRTKKTVEAETLREVITKKTTDTETLSKVIIRGNQTLSGEKPLIIIDGKESDDELAKTPADYIQSMTVLKGETATSIYGPKASGGAIIITTKDGTGSKIKEVIVDGVRIKAAEIEVKGYGQPRPPAQNSQVEVKDVVLDEIFTKVEKEAEFPGGKEAWGRFLDKNCNVTVPSDKGAPIGSYSVELQFIVHLNGSISDIKALTKHGYGMEEEAIRTLSRGPRWIPAEQNGRKVVSYKKITLTFVVADA